ncbi:acetyl-CoA carboxylase biotin carboxyl carrier protein subunit [Orrella sp. JC864]|uniref:acetyl-CoA carboxylase biotin carboxyl carrier protein subunit n=1 Tax=Orrella sp. JC864 TaxID=3120298 RepID=UPI0012BD6F44
MTNVEIEAPTTGTVWKVERKAGEPVQEGEVVLILESMKMEIPVESPRAGIVSSMKVAPGDTVEEGQILCVVQP